MRRPGGADFAPDAYVFPEAQCMRTTPNGLTRLPRPRCGRCSRSRNLARAQAGRFARDADSEHIRSLIVGGSTFGAALGTLGLDPATTAGSVCPLGDARAAQAALRRDVLPGAAAGRSDGAPAGGARSWTGCGSLPKRRCTTRRSPWVTPRARCWSRWRATRTHQICFRGPGLGRSSIVEPRMVQTEKGWEVVR